jgi:hypothetical protein
MVPSPDSQSFFWLPLAGFRHAIDHRDRNVRLGALVRCLCGDSYPRSPAGDMEWIYWPTCQDCWDQACIIVGLRPRP